MDIQKIADEIGISVETLKKLYKSFVSTTPEDLKACKAGIDGRDAASVQKTAHHIKGAAINLDLQGIAEKAKILEDASQREDWVRIPGLFTDLESLYHQEQGIITEHLK